MPIRKEPALLDDADVVIAAQRRDVPPLLDRLAEPYAARIEPPAERRQHELVGGDVRVAVALLDDLAALYRSERRQERGIDRRGWMCRVITSVGPDRADRGLSARHKARVPQLRAPACGGTLRRQRMRPGAELIGRKDQPGRDLDGGLPGGRFCKRGFRAAAPVQVSHGDCARRHPGRQRPSSPQRRPMLHQKGVESASAGRRRGERIEDKMERRRLRSDRSRGKRQREF